MRGAWSAIALAAAVSFSGCRGGEPSMEELKTRACACKDRSCAARVGAELARAVQERELDERQTQLTSSAAACLAALNE
ncbi:MAG: hypothetical protein R3B48_19715 [Kofleriaceae bacterium]